MFLFGYLTPRQRRMWALRLRGFTQADISRELGVTRQTVNKAFGSIDAKVTKALMEAASLIRADVRQVSPRDGYLLGYSPRFDTDVIITFSAKNGIQIWYKGREHCENCSQAEHCKRILLGEAEERGIQIPKDKKSEPPSELADLIFERIMRG